MSPPGSGEEKHVPPAQEKPSRGTRDFLTILFKHRSRVSVIFLAAVLAAILASFLIPPTYEARSSLMVKTGREYVNRPEAGEAGALMLLQMEEVVNSETRILSSRELIEKVLTTLKVETVYPELAASPPSTTPPSRRPSSPSGRTSPWRGSKNPTSSRWPSGTGTRRWPPGP